MKHEWGPSTVNHSHSQCVNCLATAQEVFHALGDECPGRAKKPNPLRIVGGTDYERRMRRIQKQQERSRA